MGQWFQPAVPGRAATASRAGQLNHPPNLRRAFQQLRNSRVVSRQQYIDFKSEAMRHSDQRRHT